jgi:FAD/FMN-containing dehydrogenase
VDELDVLTGSGDVVTCRRDNAHSDLFHGFPNSYGTLGYALRVRARVVPVKPFVHLEHRRFDDTTAYFRDVEAHCAADDADFIDGTLFAPDRLYLTLGRFVDEAPRTSDYTFEHIYYRSIAEKHEDWLTTRDFLWRWDTDWFWCSKNLMAQNPLVRRLYGRARLGSRTYTRIMRWNARVGLTRALDRMRGVHGESVIQDVDIPIAEAPAFLDFLAREIDLWPVWMCPIGPGAEASHFTLYPMRRALYVNFGFWDVVRRREMHEAGHFNRLVERKVTELGGIKSLYSDSYFTPAQLDAAYGGEAYRALKAKYDPRGRFPTLYEKVVKQPG